MSRLQRDYAYSDLDAVAQGRGFRSAAQLDELVRYGNRLLADGRLTEADARRAHARDSHIPFEQFLQVIENVNAGRTAHDRFTRLATVVGRSTGLSEDRLASFCEQARNECEAYAVQEIAQPLTQELDARDAHRDRQHGIDPRERVEQARKAALQNPGAIRHGDIEKAWQQHAPEPTLYAADRRENLAQRAGHNVERIRQTMVRDADPYRPPDHGVDRRDDIRLVYDIRETEGYAREELAIRDNPALERSDNTLTYAESMSE